MPQLVWVADAAGEIEYFNERWFAYTGLTVDEVRAAGTKNVVHPEDLAETWERWKRALETGEPYEIEYRLRSAADSTYRWFVARAMPVRAQGGEITHWIGSATDIDAQRRAADNLRFVIEAAG
ncbi:MAG: PAS domain-containing protein, partial [Candidatus Baltobacteraceae bacterium]